MPQLCPQLDTHAKRNSDGFGCWFIDSLLRGIEMRNRPCLWFLYCVHGILSIKHMLKGQITVGVKDTKMWKSTSFSVCVRVLVVLSCFPSLGPQCCGVYVLDLSVWVSFKKSKETTVCCRAYVCVDIWCRTGGGEGAVLLPLGWSSRSTQISSVLLCAI